MTSARPHTGSIDARLPSGRHRLAREEVEASQRGRLLVAVVRAVAEKGYPTVTVADVVERAGVSRRTFYEQFDGKESCFLAAYDFGVEFVLGRLADALEELPAADWRGRLEANITTYTEVLAGEPDFAWALHLEVLGAGPAALERRAAYLDLFAQRTKTVYERARAEDKSLPKLPDVAFAVHTGGIEELIRECLRTDGASALPGIAKPATAATFALLGR